MGKDEKEDSGFGFKDRAKAEETLRLLEAHEPNYRRLTVRGLLGRAKRTLSMTKAEEKIKNIKEAIEVFEAWQEQLDQGKEKKPAKQDKKKKSEDKEAGSGSDAEDSKDLPSESVPGLGFKDRAAAEGTIAAMKGRDVEYQKLAVKGLLKSAARTLTCTRDETKKTNINEAISILEKFVEDLEKSGELNFAYLSLAHAKTCLRLAGERGVGSEQQKAFVEAYERVKGEYKRLRTVSSSEDGPTWDIVRNKALKELREKNPDSSVAALFKEDGSPTDSHLQLLLWAYSPASAARLKALAEEDETPSRKRKSSPDAENAKKSKV